MIPTDNPNRGQRHSDIEAPIRDVGMLSNSGHSNLFRGKNLSSRTINSQNSTDRSLLNFCKQIFLLLYFPYIFLYFLIITSFHYYNNSTECVLTNERTNLSLKIKRKETLVSSRLISLYTLLHFDYSSLSSTVARLFRRKQRLHAREQVSHVTALLCFQTAASGTFYFHTFLLLKRASSKQRASEKLETAISYVRFVPRPGSTTRPLGKLP